MQKENISILPFNNPLIRFISDQKYRWLRHALFICLGLTLAYKGDFGVLNDPRPPELRRTIILADTITFFFIMGVIYFMTQILIPRLLFRSKVFLFALSFFVFLILIYLLVWMLDHYMIEPVDRGDRTLQHIDLSVVAFTQIAAVTSVLLGSVVGLVIFKKWITDVQHMHELQQVNLRTELEQLKSQVNPHFLFNTLNNLMVLMKTDPEKASQILLGLSDLLRYQLYDSAMEKILLVKDIDFIKNLLALEKIRKNDFSFEINTEGNIDNVNLPPFLFIPFVENAIKHGASTVGHSYLVLNFHATENKLFFTSENSKPPVKRNSIGGLGLKNINRRLELLYPGNHTLEITDETDKYIVNLIIPI
jgi:LytS/YehU family sensor histidine kinase